MATIAKKEKTKKIKNKDKQDKIKTTKENINEGNASSKQSETLIAELFTQSPKEEIFSQECAIASNFKEINSDNKNQNDKSSEYKINDKLSSHVESISQHDEMSTAPPTKETKFTKLPQPTAPQISNTVSANKCSIPAITLAQYPNLNFIKQIENVSKVVYHPIKVKTPVLSLSSGNLKPLTDEELKQFYKCPELEMVNQFELEFLMNSLLESNEDDPLYVALNEYFTLQSKLTINTHDIKEHRTLIREARKLIWVNKPITEKFSARCKDNITLSESVTYEMTEVDGKNLENATAITNRLYNSVCDTYMTNLIKSKIVKVCIDEIINGILSYRGVSDKIHNESTITLHDKLDVDTLPCAAELRRALAILFSFCRRLSPNKDFTTDLRAWIRKLISLHLRIATKEDHWFLLFNILRCPNGVGTWARDFIQVPHSAVLSDQRDHCIPLPINSPEMNHCISLLQILLFPIKKRNEYLKTFIQSQKDICDPVKEERWIFIDSDGEDTHIDDGEYVGLKENDLIALLNQIPFEVLFTSALNIERFLNDYIIEADLISANHILQIMAFFRKLTEIFGEGMVTYNNERYKQFGKRLGRLIRHSLQYVFDYHEIFMQNKVVKDHLVCERINIELDSLLLKCCNYIYRTKNLATWQYFSSLPFNVMHSEVIWQIFYYLNVGFPTEFIQHFENPSDMFESSDFWSKFNTANADSSPEDLYYLLQTFFEMANGRDQIKDSEFIKRICLHIFYIGFINDMTRDTCYKTSRDMLVNLTLINADLIYCLLLQMKIRFIEVENFTFLFNSLPLDNWKANDDSFEILANWLMHYDFKSSENHLARIIISKLNWGFDCDGRLFLPHNIHMRMACVISEAVTKHAPEVIGLYTISEKFRLVSNFIDFTNSTKEQFSIWCWSMVDLLRLHCMDQSIETIRNTLRNPTETFMCIPELEKIDIIYKGVSENRPLSLYIAILISLHGHSIPLICQKGFELMKILLNDCRYAVVIRCMELIIPLFLETPEVLANCERFHELLNTILNADKTYLKMAKDIIYPNSIGPVLQLFNGMIHNQITSYNEYGLSSPLNMINVWLNCFTSFPNWQNTGVVYLLDKLLCLAYQFPDAWSQVVQFFSNYYKNCEDWKGVKLSALKNLFSYNQSRIPMLLPQYGWLNLVLLDIEFNVQDAKFWQEFLRQLATNHVQPLDVVLKKTMGIVKTNSFSPQMLVIYKYANLIASMDTKHPVFPIITQKFFELYLSRLPMERDEHNFQRTYGVSDKFYQYNIPLMKKLKANFKTAETEYNNHSIRIADDESQSYFYRNCADLMKTFSLWLEETAINRQSREQLNYPPQYNVAKLYEILDGNKGHWTEYLFLKTIREEQKYEANQWMRKCLRSKLNTQSQCPNLNTKQKLSPIQRIKRNLCSYDKNMKPPHFEKPKCLGLKRVNEDTIKVLKDLSNALAKTVNKIHLRTSELKSVNRNYLDNVVNLFSMVSYKSIVHKQCNSKCNGAAAIQTVQKRIRIRDNVGKKLTEFIERENQIVDELIAWNIEDFAKSFGQINTILRLLIAERSTTDDNLAIINKIGIDFFYAIIDNMNDVTMKFQPSYELYSKLLHDLSIFIQENQEEEGSKILQLALKRPELINLLSGVFVPCRTAPQYFIKMYELLIDSYLKRCDTQTLITLLSKFDLDFWLNAFRPKLFEISNLLALVLRGLQYWSQLDSMLLQDEFRCHLIHIFNYDFPEHYGEVLQLVLCRISEHKLMPAVLLELLNSLLVRFNCETLTLNSTMDEIKEISNVFARKQNVFNLKAATETLSLFGRHFQKERLSHGLHGLYPKHKDYCLPLSMWFSCIGHTVIVTSICTYQELLSEQICDMIFVSLIEIYSPWLVVYTEHNMPQPTSKWIAQLTANSKMLSPWTEQYVDSSKIMMKTFINALCFIIENLPSSYPILNHIFSWYINYFAIPNIEKHIYWTIHEGIAILPWEAFKPKTIYIDMMYDSLHKFIPDSHALLGHIFIRINWNSWFMDTFPCIPQNVQSHVISKLFVIFIKSSFEPNIHIHIKTSNIMEDAINYPWQLVSYTELDKLFDWCKGALDPSIILRIPSETNYADIAVLDLFRSVSGMMSKNTVHWKSIQQPNSNAPAKRILYARFYIRMLFASVAKNHKLLGTKEGIKIFNNAFLELINTMNDVLIAIKDNNNLEEENREALNFMIEIILPMQSQSEEASNLMTDAIITFQQTQAKAANVLMLNILNAIGHMKSFIASSYDLLENTIEFYFGVSENSSEWHRPSWNALMHTISLSLDKLDLIGILRGPSLFVMHIYIIYQLEKMTNIGDQITFIQDVCQLIQPLKISQRTEAKMAIIWGLLISSSCKILVQTENVKKTLLLLARYLQQISTQSDGWSDGLLGAIGLKKDLATNKRKVLTRCLACIIHSLFPINGSDNQSIPNESYNSALQELTILLANKKYLDVKPLIVNAVTIIKDNTIPNFRDVPLIVCRLIHLFYPNSFLTTIPEVWHFDYIFTQGP